MASGMASMPAGFPDFFRSFPCAALTKKTKPENARRPPEPQSSPVQQALFKSRTVLIFGEVDMKMAERVTAQLLAYAAEGEGDIRVVVNSPGGHVESGDTIHDMIRFVGPRVKMIGTGWVASAGAHIYLGATKENRFCLPNTRFLLHQPLGGIARPGVGYLDRGGRDPEDARAAHPHDRAGDRPVLREGGGPTPTATSGCRREEAKAYGLVAKIINRADEV